MSKLLGDLMVELHVPSFEPAREFYGSLGFETVWEHAPKGHDGYLVMRKGETVLNFFCGNSEVYEHHFFSRFPTNSPRGYAVEIIMPVDDIDSFHEDFQRRHGERVVGPLNTKLKWKDFRFEDPYGFYIRVVERHNWLETGDPLAGR